MVLSLRHQPGKSTQYHFLSFYCTLGLNKIEDLTNWQDMEMHRVSSDEAASRLFWTCMGANISAIRGRIFSREWWIYLVWTSRYFRAVCSKSCTFGYSRSWPMVRSYTNWCWNKWGTPDLVTFQFIADYENLTENSLYILAEASARNALKKWNWKQPAWWCKTITSVDKRLDEYFSF
jgi:hypothetical protein